MSLRCRKNVSGQICTGGGGVERYMAMGRCLESPGLKEVVISFFPGASSPHNSHSVHLYKDKPIRPQGRDKLHFLLWLLFGILLVGICVIVSSRKGQVFGTFQNNDPPVSDRAFPGSEFKNREHVRLETLNSEHTSTPKPDFKGATIAAQHGDLLMSQFEKELRITFSFDDDTETLLESVDMF